MSDDRYCHDRGEDHDFDQVRGRMNAARHCRKCPCISLDWDDVDPPEVPCEWFALCDHTAEMDVPHPILGPVPTCQRCADKFGLVGVAR